MTSTCARSFRRILLSAALAALISACDSSSSVPAGGDSTTSGSTSGGTTTGGTTTGGTTTGGTTTGGTTTGGTTTGGTTTGGTTTGGTTTGGTTTGGSTTGGTTTGGTTTGGTTTGGGTTTATGVTYTVCGSNAQSQAIIAFFNSHEGDTIQFCAGEFDFTTSLVLSGKKGITVLGAGIDKTILSFKNSSAEDGVSVNNVQGFTIKNLTIYDAPGNGLRMLSTDYITVDGVKVGWSVADPASPNYNSNPSAWTNDGSYAIYPVLCNHLLIQNSISVGSDDAGFYVGQSNDILEQNNEAYHNVAGFEFENTYSAEFVNNVAHDNVGGFLVFDLPGRAQFGEKNLVHDNQSYDNNIQNFAARGDIVADVPSGTGMLLLASDQAEIYNNAIHDNNSVGLAIVNYGLIDNSEPSTKYDFFPEGIHVYNNVFSDDGSSPQLPDLSRDTCTGKDGLPGKGDAIGCIGDNATLLTLIVTVKNLGHTGEIIWDGATDSPDGCSKVPVDENGIPLNQPDANDIGRYEARVDERGRPNFYLYDPNPTCKYNAWKFTAAGALKEPQNGICIGANQFVHTKLSTLLVSDFVNFHMATADISQLSNLELATHAEPEDCPTLVQPYLGEATPNVGSFTPDPAEDPTPTTAQIAAACGAVQPGKINYTALAGFNCPTLDQYGLFQDAGEPRKNPVSPGIPYDLNTILFSDYAVKYRFLFLPTGTNGKPVKAGYQDHTTCHTLSIYDCYTATLEFPVGTVLAKTFTFVDGANETVVETRLLIKRQTASGAINWVGLPYEWTTDSNGKPYAELMIQGDTKSVSYNYNDPDPQVVTAQGQPVHYGPGIVSAYQIPNAGSCLLCHGGDDLEPGAPPIGPKVRNLNKTYSYSAPGVTVNQLTVFQNDGLVDLPGPPSTLEQLPKWNVPGNGGLPANSAADINQRARAFLEVNCMHCHNPAGNAQNSGLSLDAFAEPMDEGHGICKTPTAAGIAASVGNYDIQPGDEAESILLARLASVTPGIRMPPISRTVQDAEAVNFITPWIQGTVQQFADSSSDYCAVTSKSTGLPLFLRRPVPEEEQGKVRVAPWG